MRYRLRHVTTYHYAEPVDLACHMLHLMPRELPRQRVIAAELASEPAAGRRSTATDHFGNTATWLFLDRPHRNFRVTLAAEIEILPPAPPSPGATPPWEEVAALARVPTAAVWPVAEFARPSALVGAPAEALAYARPSFPPGQPAGVGLRDLARRMHHDFAFRPGVTTVMTGVAQVLAGRAGVCQDFSHVMIAGLRALGLPARYVSGYLRTRPPPGRPHRRGADQSHAWVEVWLGPEAGWLGIDPTNDLLVAGEHVVLGWGRDYADVSPVRGFLLGGGRHEMRVSVDLEEVDVLAPENR